MACGIRLCAFAAFAVVAAFMLLPSADAKLFVSFGPCHAYFLNDIEACFSYISWSDEDTDYLEYEDVFEYYAFAEGASFDIVRSDSTGMGTYQIPNMRGDEWTHHRAFVEWDVDDRSGVETEEGVLFQWFVNPKATSARVYREEYCGYFADSVLNLPSGYTYKIVPGTGILDLVPSGVEFVDAGYFPVRDWNASKGLDLKADNDSYYADAVDGFVVDGCEPQVEIRYSENVSDSYILGIVKVRFTVREKEYVVKFPMSSKSESFYFPFYGKFNGAHIYGGYTMIGLLSNYYVDHTTQEELDIYQFYYRECFTDDDCKTLCRAYSASICSYGTCTHPRECFIATAALGTPLDPRIWVLRSWRDNFLLKHSLTKAFVHFYYRISPPIARFLYTRPMMCAVVRWSIILPAIFVLEHLSLSSMVLISVSTILVSMIVDRWWRKAYVH